MNAPRNEGLTPAGAARRDAMLDELTGYMNRVHRSRRIRRRGVAAALLFAVAAAVAYLALPGQPTPVHQPITSNPLHSPVESSAPPVRIAVVRTDPDIVNKYRASAPETSVVRIERLDDDELLRRLDAMGRSAGLVRMGGKAWLTADVADATMGDMKLNLLPES
jgi:hypothetical protein